MTTDNPAVEPEKLFYLTEEQGAATPEEKEPEEVEEDQPNEVEEIDQDEESEGVEEPEEEAETQDLSDDDLYVDIDGREITVKDIKDWEQGNLRQSDYTKKTQALAREREEFESSKEQQVTALAKERFKTLDSAIEELESLIASDPVDMEELETYDPEEFIKQQKLQDKRRKALEKARSQKLEAQKEKEKEDTKLLQAELVSNHPEWLNEKGEQTDIFKAELKNLSEYFAKNGWTKEDQAQIKSSRVWEAVFIAAKADKSQEKAKANKGKIKKLPVVSRPGKAVKKQTKAPKTDEELFYGSK